MKLYALLDTETGEYFQGHRLFTRPGDATSAWGAHNQVRVERGHGGWAWRRLRLADQTRWVLKEVRIVPVETP